MIRENSIERYFVRRVRAIHGLPLKFKSPGRANVPDRVVLFNTGWVDFVELKRPGAKPRPGQRREHARLRALGFDVFVIDTKEGVDRYVKERALQ